jgi:predicted phosphodiesterase
LQALKKALDIIEDKNIDSIICLGDIVGYNANPMECIDILQSCPKVSYIMQGNHDRDVVCFDDLKFSEVLRLSEDAYNGLKYSNSVLSNHHKLWLKSLNEERLVEDDNLSFWVSHCSPECCTSHGYILNKWDAKISLHFFKSWGSVNLFFFGHTHLPTYIVEENGKVHFDMGRHLEGDTYTIDPDKYYLINPGSIGQPRGQGITSYAILDTKERTVKIEGFEYNWQEAQRAVLDAGYSESVAKRLDVEYDAQEAKKKAKKEYYKKRQKIRDSQKT